MGLRLLAAGLAVCVAGGAAYLGLRGAAPDPAPVPKSPPAVVESPRPPVAEDVPVAADSPITLRGRPPPRPRDVPDDHPSLVHERDEAAREHARLLQAHEAGRVSIQAVEDAELRLLDARRELGELDRPTWHRARAALYAKAVERTDMAVAAGVLTPLDAKRGVVLRELERLLAWDPNSYSEQREALFVETKRRRRARVEAGLISEREAEAEYARLVAEFPPANDVSDRPLPPPPSADEEREFLLAMHGGDLVTALYVTRVLNAHGIWSSTAGSLGWSTNVRTSQRSEAERRIREEVGLRGYVTWLPSGEREDADLPTETTVQVGKDHAAALEVHPPETILGRILRSEDLREYLRGSTEAEVETIRWVVRPLVTATRKPTTAIVATVRVKGLSKAFPGPRDVDVVLEQE